jgi:hypothetical protein
MYWLPPSRVKQSEKATTGGKRAHPVNLAITPDQHLARVANSLDRVKDGDAWKGELR